MYRGLMVKEETRKALSLESRKYFRNFGSAERLAAERKCLGVVSGKCPRRNPYHERQSEVDELLIALEDVQSFFAHGRDKFRVTEQTILIGDRAVGKFRIESLCKCPSIPEAEGFEYIINLIFFYELIPFRVQFAKGHNVPLVEHVDHMHIVGISRRGDKLAGSLVKFFWSFCGLGGRA